MIPWVHLDTGAIPNGGGTLRLMRRGQEFSIQLGQNELMNSRLSGSEEALAQLARTIEARMLLAYHDAFGLSLDQTCPTSN